MATGTCFCLCVGLLTALTGCAADTGRGSMVSGAAFAAAGVTLVEGDMHVVAFDFGEELFTIQNHAGWQLGFAYTAPTPLTAGTSQSAHTEDPPTGPHVIVGLFGTFDTRVRQLGLRVAPVSLSVVSAI